jgi:serine protease inhibitor
MLRLQIFFKVDYLAMRQKKRLTLVRIDELEADVLELPYKNEQISMVVVVPTEDSNVRKLEANLNDFDIGKINDRLDQVIYSSFLDL